MYMLLHVVEYSTAAWSTLPAAEVVLVLEEERDQLQLVLFSPCCHGHDKTPSRVQTLSWIACVCFLPICR